MTLFQRFQSTEERERLQERIDELESKLDDERQKSWWQKLRGK